MKRIVREAKFDTDFEFIVESQINLAFETEKISLDCSTVNLGVEKAFKNPNLGTYFVAEENGDVVATLLITPEWSDWRNKTCLWIQSVYVKKEARRRGIYKDLYTHIVNIVDSSDEYCGIRLYVDKTNSEALLTYKNLGMNLDHYSLAESMK